MNDSMTRKKAKVNDKIAENTILTPYNLTSLVLGLIILYFLWVFNADYITSLSLGLIVAVLTFPVFNNFRILAKPYLNKSSSGVAALTTMLLISIIVILSLNLFWSGFRKELPKFQQGIENFITDIPNNREFKNFLGLDDAAAIDLSLDLSQELSNAQATFNDRAGIFRAVFDTNNLNRTIQIGQQTASQVGSLLIATILFYLSWFFFMVQGPRWLSSIYSVIPLVDQEEGIITEEFQHGVRNVAYASLISATIHTVVAAILLLVFGIENKFIILTFVILIGILPLSPAEIAYAVPIALIFPKNPIAAVVLIPFLEALILWVNYVLIPRVIASSDNGNPLLIVTSILSGVTIFGIMGFVIGPVLMVFIQSLYRILHGRITKPQQVGIELTKASL
jgi:predicted PurR-regulated permease PerM